jgi:hypothetical protein
MNRVFAAVLAAIAVSAVVILSGIAVAEKAYSTPASAKGDRLDLKPTIGSDCSQQSWPYYEAGCLRNTVGGTRDAREVRVVSTDRLGQ